MPPSVGKPYEPYYTIKEAARLSGLSVETLYTRIHKGLIPAFGSRRKFRVQMSDVLPPVDLSVKVPPKGALRKGLQALSVIAPAAPQIPHNEP